MTLVYHDSGVANAATHMSRDAELLESIGQEASRPILHAYRWAGSAATYGYFCEPYQWLDASVAENLGMDLARRPTGGGITLHTHDLAFSFLLPSHHRSFSTSTVQNYAFVNTIVGQAIETWRGTPLHLLPGDSHPSSEGSRHFCMARATQYDLVLGSRKVGGAAQRRTRNGYLHQGTIALSWPEEAVFKPLFRDETVWEAIRKTSYPLLGYAQEQELQQARIDLMAALYRAFSSALDNR